jgi:hypothetical protein
MELNNILNLRKTKILEISTIIFSILGILLSITHGNLYDYFFNVFYIEGVFYFRMLYASLLVYSALSFIVFTCLLFLNEKNVRIRVFNYLQGWLFILMAIFAFEWLDSLMIWSTQIVLSGKFIEYPFTLLSKGASVVFFSSLFLFWFIEQKKHSKK